MSSITLKQFDLIVPNQTKEDESIQAGLQNALLLALLEQKYITLWQYEQCCTKLHLPGTTDII